MRKVVYLHGLESPQGGEKVDYLSSSAMVFAPSMNYNEVGLFEKTLKIVESLNPDLIIGSSMGGYFGYLIGTRLNIPSVLFNPALHSRTVEIEPIEVGNYTPSVSVFFGENDDIIDSTRTREILKNVMNIEYSELKNVGHRIPMVEFIDSVK